MTIQLENSDHSGHLHSNFGGTNQNDTFVTMLGHMLITNMRMTDLIKFTVDFSKPKYLQLDVDFSFDFRGTRLTSFLRFSPDCNPCLESIW